MEVPSMLDFDDGEPSIMMRAKEFFDVRYLRCSA